MTLSWKELVLHGLLVEIGEPSLVKDLLKMVMKERFSFLEEEAREFHSENVEPVINIYMSALRRPLGTWGRTAEYTASVLAEETGPFHIKYNNVKKEVRWQEAERQRRQLILSLGLPPPPRARTWRFHGCAAMELFRQFN